MRVAAILVSFLLTAAAPGQQFSELRRGFLPDTLSGFTTLVTGDYDGDGDVDGLVVPGSTAPPTLLLLRNDGEGRFEQRPAPGIANSNVRGQAVLDADGDGDLDVALTVDALPASCQFTVLLMRNQGGGNFTAQTVATVVNGFCQQLAAADLDGDGDQDLMVGMRTGWVCAAQPRVFFNDGAGTFTDVTTTVLPMATATSMWR